QWSQGLITPEERKKIRLTYASSSWFKSPELSPRGNGGTGEPPKLTFVTLTKCVLIFTDIDGTPYPIPMIVRSENNDDIQRMILELDERKLYKGNPKDSFALSSTKLVAPIQVLARADRVLRTIGEERHEHDLRVKWDNPHGESGEFPSEWGSVSRTTKGFGQTPESFARALWLASNANLKLKL
ncbi:MAG: hypothetical protein AAB768_02475, partial [Patescibacteria group bacterium]